MRNDHLTPRDTPIAAGETAPDFTLLDQNRDEVSLKSLLANGGDVVLSFYPLDFTSVCTSEMACLSRDLAKFTGKGATVVGISCDSFAAHKAFAEQEGLAIPLLADMHRQVCRAYGLYWADLNVAQRGTVVIGADGVVKWTEAREPGNAFELDALLGRLG
ncbi:MAG: redoxin domain-containing protein [Phycisphaerales bacterium]